MGKWKITLSGIGRRDEAITVATETLTEAQNRLRDDDAVIETLRRDILKEQKNNETLLTKLDEVENKIQELYTSRKTEDKFEEKIMAIRAI